MPPCVRVFGPGQSCVRAVPRLSAKGGLELSEKAGVRAPIHGVHAASIIRVQTTSGLLISSKRLNTSYGFRLKEPGGISGECRHR